jgi:hypothetical protein
MRIAVIADIHGNLPELEAVLADIERRDVDRTVNPCHSQNAVKTGGHLGTSG